jgi:acylphosphatase
MNEEPALVRHVFVEGRVQGVGYRDFTRGWALRLGISGWVRNRSDGAVEAVVRGAAADVEALLFEMRKGPRGARVTSLRIIEHKEGEAKETGAFAVRATV